MTECWLVLALVLVGKLAGNAAHMMETQAAVLVTLVGTSVTLVGMSGTEECLPVLVHAWTQERLQEVLTWATGWGLVGLAPAVPAGLL